MFTGTPWTNTLAEAYVWQRFCAPERLAETGLGRFDAWAAQFVRYETLVEVPRWLGVPQQAPARGDPNQPELRTMIGTFMPMVRNSMTGLPLPKPHRHTIAVAPSEVCRGST
jgi:N12 class adenine-specific DNA methylase